MNQLIENIELFKYISCESTLYILISMFIFGLILLYTFRWRDYLLPYLKTKRNPADLVEPQYPKMSVVIPVYDQAERLSVIIPKLFEQDYPDFEVIVVDEGSTDDTPQLLERLQLRYANLRTTFIPPTAKDICLRKFSITLGIRAARSEWVVLMTASATPASTKWLRCLAAAIEKHTDIVLGYSNFEPNENTLCKKAIYERWVRQLRCFRSVVGFGAMGAEECNYAIRKSAFLAQRGFAQQLDSPYGESHLLVDQLSTPLNVNFTCQLESVVTEEFPLPELWEQSRIEYREILHRSSSKARYYLRREGFASLLLYLQVCILLCYICLRVALLLQPVSPSIWWIAADIAMLLLLMIHAFLPLLLMNKSAKLLGQLPVGIQLWKWRFAQPWSNMRLRFLRRGLKRKHT